MINSIGLRLFFCSLSSLSIFNFKNINFHFQGFFRKKHLTSIQLRNSNTLHLEMLYGMIKCPCQIKLDWWFLFFSENHLITLPIISHDQKLWNDVKKQPCSFPSVCVCFKERNEESVTYLWWKKRSIIKQGANHFCIWGVTLVIILCISYLLLS